MFNNFISKVKSCTANISISETLFDVFFDIEFTTFDQRWLHSIFTTLSRISDRDKFELHLVIDNESVSVTDVSKASEKSVIDFLNDDFTKIGIKIYISKKIIDNTISIYSFDDFSVLRINPYLCSSSTIVIHQNLKLVK